MGLPIWLAVLVMQSGGIASYSIWICDGHPWIALLVLVTNSMVSLQLIRFFCEVSFIDGLTQINRANDELHDTDVVKVVSDAEED